MGGFAYSATVIVSTSETCTGTPPRRALSSAASMKAYISSVSAWLTGE